MKRFIAPLTLAMLLSPLASHAGCPELRFLNAYDLSKEDVSIMLSVRPEAVRNLTNLSGQDGNSCPAMKDPALAPEAGWDVSIRKAQCAVQSGQQNTI